MILKVVSFPAEGFCDSMALLEQDTALRMEIAERRGNLYYSFNTRAFEGIDVCYPWSLFEQK